MKAQRAQAEDRDPEHSESRDLRPQVLSTVEKVTDKEGKEAAERNSWSF